MTQYQRILCRCGRNGEQNFHFLEKLTFPCCLKPQDFGNLFTTEIHSFSDASDVGIGQISYLRVRNQRTEVHVSFLMAKSRVAPRKPISKRRLELTAVVVSVNVAARLKSELGIHNIKGHYCTDCEIVIGYLNNDASRSHVYAGNRVRHIRFYSFSGDWFHVPGKQNSADKASRGLTAKLQPQPICALHSSGIEVRKDSASPLSTKNEKVKTSHTGPGILEPDRFNHFSSLNRLKRCIVRAQRAIERLRPTNAHNWRSTSGNDPLQRKSFLKRKIQF